jgi:hypothetical protein
MPFFNTLAAACSSGVLRIVNSFSMKRRLRAVAKGIRFSDGLLQSLGDFRQQHRSSLPPGMINCLVVDLCMPEVVPDELGPHTFKSESYIGVVALVDPIPIDKRDSTRAAPARRLVSDHLGRS